MRIFLRVWENKFERINKIQKKYCLNNNINLKKIYSGANDKFVVWVNSKIIEIINVLEQIIYLFVVISLLFKRGKYVWE
mgnify:FL=1